MMILPLKVNDREFDLVVVLEEENLYRMREYDPAEVIKKNLGIPWTGMQIRNVSLSYLTPEEAPELSQRMTDDPAAAMRWLTRGFRYRPDLGDDDNAYRSEK